MFVEGFGGLMAVRLAATSRPFSVALPSDDLRDHLESVLGAPVGVAAELPEVRQRRVGAFDGPSLAEREAGSALGGRSRRR